MKYEIAAKETRDSGSPTRTLCVETLFSGGPFERKEVEGWVEITLRNKLSKSMGFMSIETQALIEELTELIAVLFESQVERACRHRESLSERRNQHGCQVTENTDYTNKA